MTFAIIEGVDFSDVPESGPPTAAQLKTAGKFFECIYLADDPRGRSAQQIADADSNGIDIVVVYETTETAWEGGHAQGQIDAANAQRILLARGLPATMPVYLTVDYDAAPTDEQTIDQYLAGAAVVFGLARTSIYGGFYTIERCFKDKSATRFWQTTAWSGGFLSAHANLYQWGYSLDIGGTDCDDTRALTPDFGQRSLFLPHAPKPKPPAHPLTFGTPTLPKWWGAQKLLKYPTDQAFNGVTWSAERRKSIVVRETPQTTTASAKGRPAGDPLPAGATVFVERSFTAGDKQKWVVLSRGGPGVDGARVLLSDLKETPQVVSPA